MTEIVRPMERPLGLRVRDLREHRGLSYKAAAAEIGVSVGNLHRLENDPLLDPWWSTVRKVQAWLDRHEAPPLAVDRIAGPTDPCDAECAASCPNIALRGDCQYLPAQDHHPTTPVQCSCGWRETDPGAGTWAEHMTAPLLASARLDAAHLGRRATLDPGAFVRRGPDHDGEPYGESLYDWQTRAIAAALEAHP